MVLVCGAVSSWPWWPSEHRRRMRPASEEFLLPEVREVVRVSLGDRDLSGESLATELVIDRRLVHG